MEYNPSGLTHVLLRMLNLAHSEKIYSSWRVARAIHANMACMWLAGGNKQDFRTMMGFRSGWLKDNIDQVFGMAISVFAESSYFTL